MKKIIVLFSISLLALSCVELMEEPESAKVAGMWAHIDDEGFTDRIVKFERGRLTQYYVDHDKFFVANKSVWGCTEGAFSLDFQDVYSLVSGTLYLETGGSQGKLHVDGEVMTINDMNYRQIENFSPTYYSAINLSDPLVNFAFNGGEVKWEYSIGNPVEGFELDVTAPDWIKNVRVTEDKISFTVSETTKTQEGYITLSYPSAVDESLYVTQKAAEINVGKTSLTLGYAASTSMFTYSIPNPQSGYTPSVQADADWITDVKDNGNSISFSVSENNSGTSRTGKITLTYGGISKVFIVTQTYSASSINFTPTTGNLDYTSDTYTFTYTVSNPREGQKATVSTTDSWITDIIDSNGTVTYKVSANTTGTARSAKIMVKYGDLSSTFAITQSAASITLSSSSTTCNYASAKKSFNISISNRQSAYAVNIQSDVSWITSISESNGTVSYTVAENNSGASRTGKITVAYAGVSKVYSVTQSYSAPSISFTTTSGSHDYTKGTYTFKYTISNPREDGEVSISTSDSWITDVYDSNGTVTYTIAENNTGFSRTGKIAVTYADVSKVFNVTQSYSAPDISFTPTSASHDYCSATYTFMYTISNPREGQQVYVTNSDSWIVYIEYDDTMVTYTIDDNYSGSSRTGKITLEYAGITRDFTIVQDKEAGGKNLSRNESANSYIVSDAGTYYFKPVKGNSSTSVGTVSSVAILWESFGTSTTPSVGDLIKSVSYKDGYIYFDTATTFREGNAVIAAKNSSGTILWSWHIWLTDQPQEQVYYHNAGTLMDRNLGATSATPGDVGALGLLYQWGRKDPFLGSSNISGDTIAKSTITWPSTVSSDSSNGTISYVTANPTTFVKCNTSNYDWYYTGSSSTDNTRWTTSYESKSIYDPCPAGWRIPDGGKFGIWSNALDSSLSFTALNTQNGINFSNMLGSDSTIWYPLSGERLSTGGKLSYVGDFGHYWSADDSGKPEMSTLNLNYTGTVYPCQWDFRASGYSVRCIKE